MARKDSQYIAPLPFERILMDLRPLRQYPLPNGRRSKFKNRQAALLGMGTRMGRALLRRMSVEEGKGRTSRRVKLKSGYTR